MVRAIAGTMMTFMGVVCGQSSGQGPQFEVASIKPSPPPQQTDGGFGRASGPRTLDPGLFVCEACTLSDLVMSAFHIQAHQLSGPGWIESEHFTVNARVPAGTTPEQLRLMQQNLLRERFKLTYHLEQKESPRFDLVIAKGGPKLKAAVDNPPPSATSPETTTSPKPGPDGFPVLGHGRAPQATILPNGHLTARYSDLSMEEFAAILSRQVHEPVTDATGLHGKFDFTLSWVLDGFAPAVAEPGARLGRVHGFAAVKRGEASGRAPR